MIIYDFIWRRLDQVECSDGWHAAQNMVEGLLVANRTKLNQPDPMVDDICEEMYNELESVADDNGIPF